MTESVVSGTLILTNSKIIWTINTAMETNIISSILVQAELLCQQRAVRLTRQRAEILRLVATQKRAVSAYELLDLLRINEPQAKPPTVYRALNFWLEQGVIHKIESINSYIVCHHIEHTRHTSALFVCDQCGQVEEHHTTEIENILQSLANNSHFSLKHSVIETHGICCNCQKLNQKMGLSKN